MAAIRFRETFLALPNYERSMYCYMTSQLNAHNPKIGVLLSGLDMDYIPSDDKFAEMQARIKPNSIFMISTMLKAFPDFQALE